MTSYPSWSPS